MRRAPLRLLTTVLCCCAPLFAAANQALADDPNVDALVSKGINFLRTSQAEDGSFSSQTGPAVTALIATALMRSGRTPEDPMVAKAMKYLEGFKQEDGGFYAKDSHYKNYETALVVLCLGEANKDGKYDDVLKKADAYLKGIQWDEGEDQDPSDVDYGGAGYGKHGRPDLSNTSFLVDALKATGNGPEDEAMKKALAFVSRCQNLESEYNTTPAAAKNQDGGFYYTPHNGGESPAGETQDGGLRSYGSISYAGLKSMIFAGLTKEDPRVQAAVKWIQNNYTTDSNPGMGESGLYYYYHSFAKALSALGEDEIVDKDGEKHNWRKDLVAALAKRQQENGSWVNKSTRWMEGDPNLVTGYALLALSYCGPESK